MKMPIQLLIIALLLFTLLQGCMVDRLLAVRSQMCTFDEAYRVSLFPALEMDMLEPVLLDALGPPTEVLSDNDALVYEYRLSGSEEPRHVARLVVQFDPDGVRPSQVESVYGRYRSVTDLEAATTQIYIK